jgi:hypothetical protein
VTHRDPPWITLLGATLLAAVPIAFVADVVVGVLAPSRASIPYLLGGAEHLERWPLREFDLAEVGAPGWAIDVPRGWEKERAEQESIVFDGAAGANYLIWVDARGTQALDARLLSFIGGRELLESRFDLGAGFAEGETAPQEDGQRQFVHVRRLDAERVLVLSSNSRGDVDAAAWRGLSARIVDSIRSSQGN